MIHRQSWESFQGRILGGEGGCTLPPLRPLPSPPASVSPLRAEMPGSRGDTAVRASMEQAPRSCPRTQCLGLAPLPPDLSPNSQIRMLRALARARQGHRRDGGGGGGGGGRGRGQCGHVPSWASGRDESGSPTVPSAHGSSGDLGGCKGLGLDPAAGCRRRRLRLSGCRGRSPAARGNQESAATVTAAAERTLSWPGSAAGTRALSLSGTQCHSPCECLPRTALLLLYLPLCNPDTGFKHLRQGCLSRRRSRSSHPRDGIVPRMPATLRPCPRCACVCVHVCACVHVAVCMCVRVYVCTCVQVPASACRLSPSQAPPAAAGFPEQPRMRRALAGVDMEGSGLRHL